MLRVTTIVLRFFSDKKFISIFRFLFVFLLHFATLLCIFKQKFIVFAEFYSLLAYICDSLTIFVYLTGEKTVFW